MVDDFHVSRLGGGGGREGQSDGGTDRRKERGERMRGRDVVMAGRIEGEGRRRRREWEEGWKGELENGQRVGRKEEQKKGMEEGREGSECGRKK